VKPDRRFIATIATSALLLVLTGCAAGGGAESESASGACVTDLTATFPDGTEVGLSESAAVNFGDEVSYTMYAADFAYGDENLLVEFPQVPADGHLAAVSTVVFNRESDVAALEAGQEIVWSTEMDALTFTAILAAGDEQFGLSSNGEGTLTVLEVGEQICVEIDYSDDQKSLTGTLAADVQS